MIVITLNWSGVKTSSDFAVMPFQGAPARPAAAPRAAAAGVALALAAEDLPSAPLLSSDSAGLRFLASLSAQQLHSQVGEGS